MNVVRAIIIVILLAVPGGSIWAGPLRYEIDLRVCPDADRIEVTADMEVGLIAGQREMRLLLNRGLSVRSLSADRPLEGFRFCVGERGILRYAPEASPLDVVLASPASGASVLSLRLEYDGTIEPDAWGVNSVDSAWVELGLYSGWFPLDPGMGLFDAHVRAALPPGWDALGTGGLRRTGELWEASAVGAGDIVIIAAPRLETRGAGTPVRVHAAVMDPARLEEAGAAAASILDRLTGLLGPAPGDTLDVVFAARTSGGGYVRPGLAVLQDGGGSFDDPGWTRYLGHEISHLWWFGAPTTTWEDWVNESFAEATALLLFRERHGEDTFARLVERYRTEAEAAPAIRGLDRNDDHAFEALYRRGPLLLLELEERIGRETFHAFLRELVASRAAGTGEVLSVLSRVASPSAAAELDEALDRRP